MQKNEYSAGMVKLSFWFAEFRKVVELLNAGKTMEEIKRLNQEENIFGAPTTQRATQIFQSVARRVNSIDTNMMQLFITSDIGTQKIINLIAIMNVDSLFFDFVYEVYREKLIFGKECLEDSDYRIFFKNKELQSEKVASWQDYTLKRLGGCYNTLLMEAGITDQSLRDRKILKPIIDIALENYLKDHSMEIYIRALTGVK